MNHLIIFFLALLFAPLAKLQAAEATPPNILVILVDDMGWGDPQCFNPQSKIATPDIRSAA